MKYYKPETVNENLPGIILLSHGPFAVSLLDTARMLFGDAENLAAFSLKKGMMQINIGKLLRKPSMLFLKEP